MIAPQIPLVRDGQILSVGLVNSLINRTEYAADLLRQYKLIAGNGMYVEPHFDGTRVSYLQPVKGGATPLQGLLTESEKKLEDLLDDRVPQSEFADGYEFDAADIQKLYGEDARLWVEFSTPGPVGGDDVPYFDARPVPGFTAVLFLIIGGFPLTKQGRIPAPPYILNFPPYSTTIISLSEAGSPNISTSIKFKIGTDFVNPFL